MVSQYSIKKTCSAVSGKQMRLQLTQQGFAILGAAPKQSSHPGGFEPKRVCRGLGQKQWVPDFRLYCLVLPTKGTDPMAQVYITITIFAVLNVVTGVF